MGEFVQGSLRYLMSGTVVEVVLSGAASEVFLADDANVRKLERGDVSGFRGYGGPFDRSPVRLGAPSGDRWNVVVFPMGGTVSVTSVLTARDNGGGSGPRSTQGPACQRGPQ